MYAGTTLTKYSGRIFGAHQKIDRMARKQLKDLLEQDSSFPSIKEILSFEGHNGPDAVKRKSPAKDEPWHYFMPRDPTDTNIIQIIESHYAHLSESLKQADHVRAAFEAAWMAHAVVDGLTPAHHYPYGEKVVELRGGKGLDSRTSFKEKVLMPGTTFWKLILNNWRFWGPKGLFTTHYTFELGIATMIKPMSLTREECIGPFVPTINAKNLARWYRDLALDVDKLHLFDRFCESGWTRSLGRDIKKQLMPIIVAAVTLCWYGAAKEAAVKKKRT